MKFQNEAAFQTAFKSWAKENITETTAMELKLVKTGKFQLSSWIKRFAHQARGLMGAKKNGVYHKIADGTSDLKPFDCFFIKEAQAYLIVYFNEFEKFVVVDIDEILSLTKKMKSVSFGTLASYGKIYCF